MKDNHFGKALSDLIDNTGIFDRTQWANYLIVSPSAISQWTTGKTIPRADYLQSILQHLECVDSDHVQEGITSFYKVADRPLREVMPKDLADRVKGAQTMSDYIASTYMFPLQMEINRLPGQLKKDFIFLCTNFCRHVQTFSEKNNDDNDIQTIKTALRKLEKNKMATILQDTIEENIYRTSKLEYPEKIIAQKTIKEHTTDVSFQDLYCLESLNKIDISESKRNYRCEILLWNFNKEDNQALRIKELDAEEIIFLKIKGRLRWKFSEHESYDLIENNLLWLKKPKLGTDERWEGFSNSKMFVEEDGYGIALIYNESGINLSKTQKVNQALSVVKDMFIPDLIPRKIIDRFRPLYRNSCHKIPISKDDLLKTFNSGKYQQHESIYNLHHRKQDVYLKSMFKDWADLTESMFFLKLVRFEGIEKNRDDIKLQRHYGTEIIIPLTGSFKIFTTEIRENDSIDTEYPVSSLDPSEIREMPIHWLDTDMIPSVIIFNSETPHAYVGSKEGAICLLITSIRHVASKSIDNDNNLLERPVANPVDTRVLLEYA